MKEFLQHGSFFSWIWLLDAWKQVNQKYSPKGRFDGDESHGTK